MILTEILEVLLLLHSTVAKYCTCPEQHHFILAKKLWATSTSSSDWVWVMLWGWSAERWGHPVTDEGPGWIATTVRWILKDVLGELWVDIILLISKDAESNGEVPGDVEVKTITANWWWVVGGSPIWRQSLAEAWGVLRCQLWGELSRPRQSQYSCKCTIGVRRLE